MAAGAAPAILVVARFDDAHHAHTAQRCRALERLGCRVDAFDLLQGPGFFGRMFGSDLRTRLRKAVEAMRADIVLVIGAAELDAELVEQLARATAIPWVNWFPDDLRTVDDVIRRAGAYDRVFVAGSDLSERVGEALGRPIEVVPLAADPSIYRPLRSRDQYRANVVFAGSATPRRVALLNGLAEFGLALWGPGWRGTPLSDYCRGEVPSTEEYVRAYGGASVAVNIHHTAGANGAEASLNQRVFEVAAIGVPQVVDERGDLGRHFEPGVQLLAYQDAQGLRDAVQALLQDTALAAELGQAARREVLARHTYMHRMRQVLEGIIPR